MSGTHHLIVVELIEFFKSKVESVLSQIVFFSAEFLSLKVGYQVISQFKYFMLKLQFILELPLIVHYQLSELFFFFFYFLILLFDV